jgi:hypothetical protein
MHISIINIVKNINPLINHKQEIENQKPKLQSEETRYKQEKPKLNEMKGKRSLHREIRRRERNQALAGLGMRGIAAAAAP